MNSPFCSEQRPEHMKLSIPTKLQFRRNLAVLSKTLKMWKASLTGGGSLKKGECFIILGVYCFKF